MASTEGLVREWALKLALNCCQAWVFPLDLSRGYSGAASRSFLFISRSSLTKEKDNSYVQQLCHSLPYLILSMNKYSLLFLSYVVTDSSPPWSTWFWNVSSEIRFSCTTLDFPDAFFFSLSIWLTASVCAASYYSLFSRARSSTSKPSSVVCVMFGLVTILAVFYTTALLLEIDLFLVI